MNDGADAFFAEQKLPIVGDYYVRDIPPSDNVSTLPGVDRKNRGLMYLSTAVLMDFSDGKRHTRPISSG